MSQLKHAVKQHRKASRMTAMILPSGVQR